MERLLHADEIDILIEGQESRIRFYYGHAAGIALFGISILVLNNVLLFKDNEVAKTAVNITGAFISALSSFPIKEIISRKDKMDVYRLIKRQIINFHEEGVKMSRADRADHVEYVNRFIEMTVFK